MKKIIIATLISMIPLLLLTGNAFSFVKNMNKLHSIPKNRAWRVAEIMTEYYDMNAWNNDSRYVYHYNPVYPSRVDRIDCHIWFADTQTWYQAMQMDFTYLPNQEYVEFIEMSYIMPGMPLIPMMRCNAYYDTQNRLTHMFMTSFDMNTNEWIQTTRIYIIYGPNNTFEVYQWYNQIDERPGSYDKITFQFDGQGRITEEFHQSSADSLNWVNNYHSIVTYHPHDTTTGTSFISYISHELPAMMFMENEGPVYGMLQSEIGQNWDGSGWINSEYDTYSYDTQDRLLQLLHQYWDDLGENWIDDNKDEYNYDTNGNVFQVLSSYWEDWNSQWTPMERRTYTWQQYTDSEDNIAPFNEDIFITAYPNPFKSVVFINLNSKSNKPVVYSIYNVKGQLIERIIARSNEKIEWQAKPEIGSGIFLINATIDTQEKTVKLLKVK